MKSSGRANRRLEALLRKESEESIVTSTTIAKELPSTFQPWVDKYKPSTLETHFVHKKRIEEVNVWLNKHTAKKQPSICLLTGPPGSGKTATIFLLARQNSITVKEWINPMSLTEFNQNLEFNRDDVQGRSQLDLFSDFLLRSSQYSALPLKGVVAGSCNKRIILVEDFPNMFYKQASLFHQLLRNYAKVGGCPLIFIMTDAASSDGSINKLFPQALLNELKIQQFSLNPVAASYIVKFLGTILCNEALDVQKELLEDIAVACSGDIRWAINHLQFKLQQVKQSIFKRPILRPKRGNTGQIKDKESKVPKLDERDETLFLFRALGKVLYSKRDPCLVSHIENDLKSSLIEQRRQNPLLEVPETIGHKMEVSPETFFHFLHHNHVSFFTSMENLAQASAHLADSALIFSQWVFDDSSARNYKNRDTREELGLSIAIRGLMHSNKEKATSTWKPLRKPMMAEVNSTIQKTYDNARFLFSTESPLTRGFYPELLPFYAKLLPPSLRPDQVAFLKDVNLTNKTGPIKNSSSGMLNEKDAVDDDNDTEMILNLENIKVGGKVGETGTVTIVTTHPDSEEEEFIIEEYDY